MRALVYHGPGQKAWAEVADPEILVPASFELARPGGRIANIGVHGEPVALHLEEQWIRDITITTGLAHTSSAPTLMLITGFLHRELGGGWLPPDKTADLLHCYGI